MARLAEYGADKSALSPVRIDGTRAWTTLGLLGLLYIISFVDRSILALLIQPLKADLGLTDVQLGLLFGTAFALLYALSSLPIARIADRGNRKLLILAGVIIWGCCTMASGFARSFTELAILRFGLAVGEAALTPAAFSLIADSFSPQKRILAATIFSASGMVGSATAYLVGGVLVGAVDSALASGAIAHWQSWRVVFVIVGAPAIVVAALLAVVGREPFRHGSMVRDSANFAGVLSFLWQKRALYIGLFGGAGAAQICVNSTVAWGPTYLQRVFGYSVSASGYAFGLAQAFSAIGGTLVVATLMRTLMRRSRMTAAAHLFLYAAVIGAILVVLSTLTNSAGAYLCIYAIGAFLLIGSSNTVIILLQQIAPPDMRATLTAMSLIFISSLGIGLGPPLAALIAGLVPEAASPMSWGLFGVSMISLVGAFCFYRAAARPIETALRSASA